MRFSRIVMLGNCVGLAQPWAMGESPRIGAGRSAVRSWMIRWTSVSRRRCRQIPTLSEAESERRFKGGSNSCWPDQNPNGSWGSATRTKGLNIYAPVPGAHHAFRAATTSLCIAALIEVAGDDPAAKESIDRAEAWLLEHLKDLRRATGDAIYNVWGHGYSIQALGANAPSTCWTMPKNKSEIVELIDMQFDMLTRYESVDGGWGYYDFRYQGQPADLQLDQLRERNRAGRICTRPKQIGVEPPERIVKRAIAALRATTET